MNVDAIKLGSISCVSHSVSVQKAFNALLSHLPFVFHRCFADADADAHYTAQRCVPAGGTGGRGRSTQKSCLHGVDETVVGIGAEHDDILEGSKLYTGRDCPD